MASDGPARGPAWAMFGSHLGAGPCEADSLPSKPHAPSATWAALIEPAIALTSSLRNTVAPIDGLRWSGRFKHVWLNEGYEDGVACGYIKTPSLSG